MPLAGRETALRPVLSRLLPLAEERAISLDLRKLANASQVAARQAAMLAIMRSGAGRVVQLVWLCFLVRGAFNCVLLPLWEGYDEWAHFAYVQVLASGGGLPVLGKTAVSREVAESLALTPLPYGHHQIPVPFLTHDAWWKLPSGERETRRSELLSLPRQWAREPNHIGLTNYEAQQPPLYYALLTPVQRLAGCAALPERVLLARLWSLLLASLSVPLTFLAGRRVFGSEPVAAGAAAVLAAMPGMVMTAGRVGNEGLAAAIFAALVLAVLSGTNPIWTGVLLGLGLLTKAYFLTAVPAVIAVALVKSPRRRALAGAALSLAVAAAMSGWWYWRNHELTGSWSGLQQVAARSDVSMWALAAQIPRTDWTHFFDVAFFTHIWPGNWSFLQVRGWMYRVFAAVVVAAAAGLAVRFRREPVTRQALRVLAAFYGFFWLGLCYHELTFSVLGFSSGAGWYVYAVVAAELLLACLGLLGLVGAHRALPVMFAGSFLFVALDLYGTHFLLLPYYTGLTAHAAGGGLASFHIAQVAGGGWTAMWSRLMLPAPFSLALWQAYLGATGALPVLAGLGAREAIPTTIAGHAARR